MAGIAMVANALRGLETIFDMMMVMVMYISDYTRCIEGTWTWIIHVFHFSLIHLVRHQWLCASMHMHALQCQYHKNMFGIKYISTPKVPASFPLQVQRSHTLSNWDAIQNASCIWSKAICSLRSSAKTEKKSRQRKKQIQNIALVAMSTWTWMTYSMKCLKSSDVVGPPAGYFLLNPSWRYSIFQIIFSACFGVKNCCIVPLRQLLVETYGLNVNHRDSFGQTCSSTGIYNGGPMNTRADRRKEDIRWCTKMQRVCVNVCMCVSCSFP